MSTKLHSLLEKLASDSSTEITEPEEQAITDQGCTDPDYVEKLASALDFLVKEASCAEHTAPKVNNKLKDALKKRTEKKKEVTKTAADTSEVVVAEAVDKLRGALLTKIASQEEAVEQAHSSFLDNLLGRIQSAHSSSETEAAQDEQEKTATEHSASNEEGAATITDEGGNTPPGDATKTASRLTLANMLDRALSSDSDGAAESATDESVKTAADHEESASVPDMLRSSLLSRIGRNGG